MSTSRQKFDLPQMKAYFEEKNREFVVVGITPNSEAFEKEVKMGDRIISVDEAKPFGIEDFEYKLKKAEQKGTVSLTLLSGTSIYTINLRVGKSDEQNWFLSFAKTNLGRCPAKAVDQSLSDR